MRLTIPYNDPLLGRVASLDALFTALELRGHPYPAMYFLGGLPGSLDLRTSRALYARPTTEVLDVLRPRMTHGRVGSFRAVQSTYWHDRGQLPIWAADPFGIANVFVATVPWSELDRFNEFDHAASAA